jgi:hypothetical protein
MPGKIIYALVRLTVAEVEEVTPATMEHTNEVLEAYRYKAAAAAACKARGGREAGYGVAKVTMGNKPEDEGFVWATMYLVPGEPAAAAAAAAAAAPGGSAGAAGGSRSDAASAGAAGAAGAAAAGAAAGPAAAGAAGSGGGRLLTMGVHGNERGAVGTKERCLRREADLGIADGDPYIVVRIPLS